MHKYVRTSTLVIERYTTTHSMHMCEIGLVVGYVDLDVQYSTAQHSS